MRPVFTGLALRSKGLLSVATSVALVCDWSVHPNEFGIWRIDYRKFT